MDTPPASPETIGTYGGRGAIGDVGGDGGGPDGVVKLDLAAVEALHRALQSGGFLPLTPGEGDARDAEGGYSTRRGRGDGGEWGGGGRGGDRDGRGSGYHGGSVRYGLNGRGRRRGGARRLGASDDGFGRAVEAGTNPRPGRRSAVEVEAAMAWRLFRLSRGVTALLVQRLVLQEFWIL